MSFSPRSSFFLWIVVPVAALGYLLVLTNARLERVDNVTNLVETEVAIDPVSPTGYAGGLRDLIAPAHNNESYQWIIQTQQMLAPGGSWRIREVTYDNAPIGRTVLTPSPYRWWLGFVAKVDHSLSGLWKSPNQEQALELRRPIGLSAERAARIADPVWHVLLFIATASFVAWRFGLWPASLVSVALVTLFPFGGTFLPGQPGDGALVVTCLVASMLLLLAGIIRRPSTAQRVTAERVSISSVQEEKSSRSSPEVETFGREARASAWFFAAGMAGGIGLWVDAIRSVPVVAGIGIAGVVAILCARRAKAGATSAVLPWRAWALGGAATTLAAYLLEYFPDHLGTLSLQEVHPLYGVAWLGLGEVLTRLTDRLQQGVSWSDSRNLAALSLAVLAMAAVPLSIVVTDAANLFTLDPNATRLTNLVGSPLAQNLWAWLLHDGVTLTVVATCLPLLLLALAMWLIVWSRTDETSRVTLALGLGPTLVMFVFSCFQLRCWNDFDAVLLGLMVALTVTIGRVFDSKFIRAGCVVGMFLVLLPGAMLLTKEARADRRAPATEDEIAALIERDLAHWLARQAGPHGAVILAPPNLTTSLIYHGGMSGLGTPFWENKAGFVAAMRIVGASSPDEAQAVAQKRNLSYIVMPSWDNFLEDYVRQSAPDVQQTLLAFLKTWRPPRWLRPIPYHLPNVAGFEAQSVAIFRVVEVQDNAIALSYLAEYFAEMGMMSEAAAVAQTLERSYPADLGAAVARTLVARARKDVQAFGRAIDGVQAALARDEGESLAWDRRVSLAIALVDADLLDQAREEVKHCLVEIDEPRLRSLTTVSLYRLLVMIRTFGLKIDNAQLRSLARDLLPPELRERPRTPIR